MKLNFKKNIQNIIAVVMLVAIVLAVVFTNKKEKIEVVKERQCLGPA